MAGGRSVAIRVARFALVTVALALIGAVIVSDVLNLLTVLGVSLRTFLLVIGLQGATVVVCATVVAMSWWRPRHKQGGD